MGPERVKLWESWRSLVLGLFLRSWTNDAPQSTLATTNMQLLRNGHPEATVDC